MKRACTWNYLSGGLTRLICMLVSTLSVFVTRARCLASNRSERWNVDRLHTKRTDASGYGTEIPKKQERKKKEKKKDKREEEGEENDKRDKIRVFLKSGTR